MINAATSAERFTPRRIGDSRFVIRSSRGARAMADHRVKKRKGRMVEAVAFVTIRPRVVQ
jgi:hypothetical protein